MGKRIALLVIVFAVLHIIFMLRFEGYAEMWDAIFAWLKRQGEM